MPRWAMFYAKRLGGDRIEAFRPALREHGTDTLTLEADLRRAIGREEIKVLYRPVVRLEDRTIAGFEAFRPAGITPSMAASRRRISSRSPSATG